MGVSNHERYMLRLEAAGFFFWLLKDACWVLLLPALAFPAAAAAICLEFHGLLLRWGADTTGVLVHGVAVLLWLLGNSIWMLFELLFLPTKEQEHGRQLPWYSGPLAVADKKAYEAGILWAMLFFGAAVLLLGVYYARSARDHLRRPPAASQNPQDGQSQNPQEAQAVPEPLVFGVVTPEVYQWLFIGPWVLKDMCWNREMLLPGLFFAALALALVLDCLRRFRSTLLLAELLWVVGNTTWMIGELWLRDAALWPRALAAALLLAGAGVSLQAFFSTGVPGLEHPAGSLRDTSEKTPLVGERRPRGA